MHASPGLRTDESQEEGQRQEPVLVSEVWIVSAFSHPELSSVLQSPLRTLTPTPMKRLTWNRRLPPPLDVMFSLNPTLPRITNPMAPNIMLARQGTAIVFAELLRTSPEDATRALGRRDAATAYAARSECDGEAECCCAEERGQGAPRSGFWCVHSILLPMHETHLQLQMLPSPIEAFVQSRRDASIQPPAMRPSSRLTNRPSSRPATRSSSCPRHRSSCPLPNECCDHSCPPPPSPPSSSRLPRPPLASLIRRLPSSFAACLPRPPPASIVRRLPQSSAAFTSARTSPTTLNLTHRRVQPMGDAACSPGMTRHAALGRCGMRLRNDAACSPGTPRHANLGRHDMQPRDDAACNSGTTRRAALG